MKTEKLDSAVEAIAQHVKATRRAEVLIVCASRESGSVFLERLRDSDVPRDAVNIITLDETLFAEVLPSDVMSFGAARCVPPEGAFTVSVKRGSMSHQNILDAMKSFGELHGGTFPDGHYKDFTANQTPTKTQ